jgi:probable addiction module antidote protein
MKNTDTTKWKLAEHVKTQEDATAYLKAAMEESDPNVLLAALGDIARSEGMSKLTREVGVTRESLYVSLSSKGNPSFATVFKVLRALGYGLALRVTD